MCIVSIDFYILYVFLQMLNSGEGEFRAGCYPVMEKSIDFLLHLIMMTVLTGFITYHMEKFLFTEK